MSRERESREGVRVEKERVERGMRVENKVERERENRERDRVE